MTDPELILKEYRENNKDVSKKKSNMDTWDAFGAIAFFDYVYIDGKKLPIEEAFNPVVTDSDDEDYTEAPENVEE